MKKEVSSKMPLTDVKIRSLKPKDKPYKVYDEGGLVLLIRPNGRKIWRFRYRLNHKDKSFKIGAYPDLSLSEARIIKDNHRKSLEKGIDPLLFNGIPNLGDSNKFQHVANEWFTTRLKDCTDKHKSTVKRYLDKELNPYIGHRPIREVTTQELLQIIRKVEDRGVIYTAHRIRGVLGQIFRFGMACGLTDRDPSVGLQGAMTKHKTQHFAALTDPKDVAQLMRDISNYQGSEVVKRLMQISPLLLCRPGEVRLLQWNEVDFDKACIVISKERMKVKREHWIPLSSQAIEILQTMFNFNYKGQYVFPSVRDPYKPLSNNVVNRAFRSMNYDKGLMTAHGFRAMARTILDEVLKFPPEIIEHQLAHKIKDPLGRAYNRSNYLPQRKYMLQQWADYLFKL